MAVRHAHTPRGLTMMHPPNDLSLRLVEEARHDGC